MTFLEELQAHKGGLIRLKDGLFWYGGRGWDGVQDRICLLMDSVHPFAATVAFEPRGATEATACLLIDGRPHWVCIAPVDVELL